VSNNSQRDIEGLETSETEAMQADLAEETTEPVKKEILMKGWNLNVP
jgi:hypothetical protein